jgi:predicted nucleic acid-binding protein
VRGGGGADYLVTGDEDLVVLSAVEGISIVDAPRFGRSFSSSGDRA